MADVKRPSKRTYASTKRAAQAEATRRSIVEAALRAFPEAGYTGTTIRAIADEAGVAVQTVYAVFGNKRELLRHALEVAVSGDEPPDAVTDRADFRAIAAEPDPRRRAELDAAFATAISRRVAPILKVVREAAAADPEFAATAAAITAQRRVEMTAAAKALAGPEGLTMALEQAVGTLYVLYSPDVFTSLTEDLGWSVKRYERWLADMLYRSICMPPT